LAALDLLFEKGEVLINMSYTQSRAQGRINNDLYPKTVRTFVMDEGSIFNTHFTAIPFNSQNKAAAMIVANVLLSPEMQLSKNVPEVWGDFTVLSVDKLDADMKSRFNALDLGVATLPLEELEAKAVPEIPSEYVSALELNWEQNVLRD
jgi:putative spermidine/putrescine transport system substrate-binding protein